MAPKILQTTLILWKLQNVIIMLSVIYFWKIRFTKDFYIKPIDYCYIRLMSSQRHGANVVTLSSFHCTNETLICRITPTSKRTIGWESLFYSIVREQAFCFDMKKVWSGNKKKFVSSFFVYSCAATVVVDPDLIVCPTIHNLFSPSPFFAHLMFQSLEERES